MTTVAWWHGFAGIAGDMALGSLVDAGADLSVIESQLCTLGVDGWAVSAQPVLRGGLAGTQVVVEVVETGATRTYATIHQLVSQAGLPARAKQRALATFARLAEVEGRLHRRPPAEVHFHEVGGVDAIIDVVGTCLALEQLGVDEVWAAPLATGTGTVRAAHGILPNPAPAVLALLEGAPVYGVDRPVELTTPTGAALLSTLATGWGPLPSLIPLATGYGAGSRELDGLPNLAQVVVGERTATTSASSGSGGQPVALLEANVDDATGEVLAHTVSTLLAAGAYDAWITPVVGKKGRPAYQVSALADMALVGQVRRVLLAETGSLGVRRHQLDRWTASRRLETVEVDGQPVRVKVSPGRVKAEYDDAARVAAGAGRPLREVAREAEEAAGLAGRPERRASGGGNSFAGMQPGPPS